MRGVLDHSEDEKYCEFEYFGTDCYTCAFCSGNSDGDDILIERMMSEEWD